MNASSSILRRTAMARSPSIVAAQRQWIRNASNSSQGSSQKGGKAIGFASVFATAAAGAYFHPHLTQYFASEPVQEEAVIPKAEIHFEKSRRKASSKEDNRDLISSQHLQVKNSWEHPGVYAWGSNVGKVIDPLSNEKYVKQPWRIAHFDGQLLRDLKLTSNFGAAITENGDLVQWGLGYSKTSPGAVPTLKNKDLVKIDVSADRILALSRKGDVFSVPASRDDQVSGLKEEQTSGSWSFWSAVGQESINFRKLTPSSLRGGEKVVDISSGQEHCLLLTSKGRVFSAAASAQEFPSRGQMGVPGLSWENRPKGPYDQAHEITTLQGFNIAKIAAGDFHSVVLDKLGRIFSFGDNSFGQLGMTADFAPQYIEAPTMIPVNRLYPSNGVVPTVASIAAGGSNTFFAVDANSQEQPGNMKSLAPSRRIPPMVADLWACGQGVYGSLGTGRWTHVSQQPTKVKALSSMFEFDEKNNKMAPIRVKALSVGTTHASAVLDNVTETAIAGTGSENATNWGSDVLFWGGNEHYQLGTGKRTNINLPTYIGSLDKGAADAEHGRKGELHRMCITPRKTVRLGADGKGRKVSMEQMVECGRHVSAVYSAM